LVQEKRHLLYLQHHFLYLLHLFLNAARLFLNLRRTVETFVMLLVSFEQLGSDQKHLFPNFLEL
jgi:hypothetical protein